MFLLYIYIRFARFNFGFNLIRKTEYCEMTKAIFIKYFNKNNLFEFEEEIVRRW